MKTARRSMQLSQVLTKITTKALDCRRNAIKEMDLNNHNVAIDLVIRAQRLDSIAHNCHKALA